MKTKLVGILICTLLIATTIPVVGTMNIKQPLSCDANGPYEGNIMEDIEFEGTATGGIPPYEYFWDYGDGNASSGDPHPTHNYANAGNYTVTLMVTDSEDDTANDTTWAWINTPPNVPIIDGETNGKKGSEYEYSFNTTDPDGDPIMYLIDWGDNNTEWTEYGDSGEEILLRHTWNKKGTYTIKAKAKDIYGAEGPEGSLEVTMPKNKAFNFNFNLLRWLFDRFPNMFPILRQVMGL